jgi:hypothetical protein
MMVLAEAGAMVLHEVLIVTLVGQRQRQQP